MIEHLMSRSLPGDHQGCAAGFIGIHVRGLRSHQLLIARHPNCCRRNLPVVSTRLRDDDRSPTVLVSSPSVPDFAEWNSLSVDTQLTRDDMRHKLADGF